MVVSRWLFLIVLACTNGCSGANQDSSLEVYAAASLTQVFIPLADAFEASHDGIELRVQFASSGALREQLLSGAPADVFLSADERNVEQLVEAQIASKSTVFSGNSLVLAAPAGNPSDAESVSDMTRPDVLVGLCIASAPCGAAADAILDQVGIKAAVATREPNAAALRTKLAAGELDLGVVYASDVAMSNGSIELVAVLPQSAPTNYVAASITDTPLGSQFIEFLLSDQAQSILRAMGFESAPR